MLLSAAVLAAGVASSMASAVYSVNVVGYINVTTAPGFNMIANQLDVDGVDAIGTVLGAANTGAALDGCQVETFDKVHSAYNVDVYDNSGFSGPPGWYDNVTGNPSTNKIAPGRGFFFFNSKTTNVVLTIAGTVLQGTNLVPLTSGFNLISTPTPVAGALLPATNGFPVTDTMQYEAFTNTTGHAGYAVIDYYDASGFSGPPAWYNNLSGLPETPTPAVGQGYFLYTPSTVTWSNVFIVQ